MEKSVKVRYPGEVTTEIQQEFNRVETQYRQRNYDYAYAGFQHFIESYTYNELTDEAYYKQGKIFLLTGRLSEARAKFAELADKSPHPVYREKAKYMSGFSFYKQERYDDALSVFKDIQAETLEPKLRVQFYSLVIRASKNAQSEFDFAAYSRFRLFDLYGDYADEDLKKLRGKDIVDFPQAKNMVEGWLATSLSSDQIPSWMKKYPQGSSKAYITYKIGKIYYEEKNYKKARKFFSDFLRYYPKHEYAMAAQKILTEIGGPVFDENAQRGDYKVGLILPLSGDFESYGLSVLDGVKCAAGDHNLCGEFSGIDLVIRDSGMTPATTRLAVESLIQEKVSAIIGPLSGSLAIEAGIIASQYKIPVFPITQKSGLMEQGGYIFQVGFPPKEQVQALVKEAFGRGYRSFGVYYPNNNYGQTLATLFVEEVRSRGGRITANSEYNRNSRDHYAEARKLKKSIGRFDEPTRQSGFDALFIPDSYQLINLIVPALLFNDIKNVPLLGTNAWNDPGLTLSIADQFPGSFFVDLYDGNSKSKRVQDFVDKFGAAFGRSPRVLEAVGYDVMMMIRSAAGSGGGSDIKDVMEQRFSYSGVTGIRGFRANEGPIVESSVLNIKESGIKN